MGMHLLFDILYSDVHMDMSWMKLLAGKVVVIVMLEWEVVVVVAAVARYATEVAYLAVYNC